MEQIIVNPNVVGTFKVNNRVVNENASAFQKVYPLVFTDGDLDENGILWIPGKFNVAAVKTSTGEKVGAPILYGETDTQVDLDAYRTYYGGALVGNWTIIFNVEEPLDIVVTVEPEEITEEVVFNLILTANDVDFMGAGAGLLLEGTTGGLPATWEEVPLENLVDEDEVPVDPEELWMNGNRSQPVKILSGTGYTAFRITATYERTI